MAIMMKNVFYISGLWLTLLFSFYCSALYAEESVGKRFNGWYGSGSPGVSAVKFQQYNEVCGRCHFPYQPGLLPAMSWEEIMLNADNHFGEALKLSPVELRTISRYLLDNSAGRVNDDISNSILQTLIFDPVVIRITEAPYIVNMHNQLEDEKKIRGFGQCDRCHQGAAQGKY